MSEFRKLSTRGVLAGCLLVVGQWAAAAPPVDRLQAMVARFGVIHTRIDEDTTGKLDNVGMQDEVLALVEDAIAHEPQALHGQAILIAIDMSNRLATRNVDREQLLARLSRLGYGLDLRNRPDTVHAELVFALGILEHARGDMQAARMWFDSTLTFRARGLERNVIAAAAKLRGYVNLEEGQAAAAADDFALALALLERWGGRADDIIDARSAWAAATVAAGRDPAPALIASRRAYRAIVEDETLRRGWTFAYIVYNNHARVLGAVGEIAEARTVAAEGLALCASRDDRTSAAYIQLTVARFEVASEHFPEAVKVGEAAVSVFSGTGQENHVAEGHEILELAYEGMGDLRRSLHHAREARRLRLKLGESSRLEGILGLQRDYRTAQAEHQAQLAGAAAARAELESSRATSQRTALLLAILCAASLLALAFRRLRAGRRQSTELERQVEARTAELARQTHELEAKTRELETKTRSLEASNKELERFAYIASHDLKTPLRNVTSFLGLIQRRMPPEAEPLIGEFVGMAQQYAQVMDALVSDVQKFSCLNGELPEASTPVGLRELCLRLLDERRDRSSTGAAPAVDVLGAASLYAPESFLRQLIGNLVDNGLKYNTAPQPRVTVELFDAPGEVTIRVRDNGIGIAREYHERVFEMFRRLHTRDDYEGTGLGLASCRKIAERLGGGITLESEVGVGSTFTVRLPVRGVTGVERLKGEVLKGEVAVAC